MLTAVRGYYDGAQIVVDDDDRKNLISGDELVITVLNRNKLKKVDERLEKRSKIIDSDRYVMETGRLVEEVDRDIKEMRKDDRF